MAVAVKLVMRVNAKLCAGRGCVGENCAAIGRIVGRRLLRCLSWKENSRLAKRTSATQLR